MKHANPQGKGQVTVLSDWAGAQPTAVSKKSPHMLLADYFTSLLILSADFGFQPRAGVAYHLYHSDQRWQLSLVSPQEWGEKAPGVFLGKCELLKDMTWSLALRDDLAEEPGLLDSLRQLHEGFIAQLGEAECLEDTLPFYAAELPYYRRLLAAGLASSLSQSLSLAGLDKASGQQWLGKLLSATHAADDAAHDPPTQEYSPAPGLAFFPSS